MDFYKKKDFLYKKIGNKYLIINQNKGTTAQFNEVSFFLWSQLKKPIKKTDLILILTQEYDVKKNQANSDIDDFLKKALKFGLINKIK